MLHSQMVAEVIQVELLTPDERANVLNLINDVLRKNKCNLEVFGYEDLDGVFFNVLLGRINE